MLLIKTFPESGFRSPTMQLAMVVFPDPFGPMRAYIVPGGIESEIPSIA